MEALARTFAAIEELAGVLREHGVPPKRTRFCATSATRDARNAAVFVEGVQARLGVTPQVLSGAEEAALVYAGTVDGLLYLSGTGLPTASTRIGYVTVEALAVDAEGYLLAGTDGAGVFRGDREGTTWTPRNTGLGGIVTALAVGPDGTVYAGTTGGGVFRSRDRGQSWTVVNTGLHDLNIEALAVRRDGVVFAGTTAGRVYRSLDAGLSWTDTSFPGFSIRGLALDDDQNLFAGTDYDAGVRFSVFMLPADGNRWLATGLAGRDVLTLTLSPLGDIFAATPAWSFSPSPTT